MPCIPFTFIMTTGAAPSARLKPKQRDDEFYISLITFEVEGILFRVPRRPFETDSETFRDMFTLPPTSGIVDGSSDDHPLILNGIAATDFRALIKALLSPAYGSRPELSVTEWISVLRLARLWYFEKLFDAATDALDELLCDNPVLKISLANKYNIAKWLRAGYFKLVMRLEPLTMKEAETIGTACVLKLAELREQRYKWVLDGHIRGLWDIPARCIDEKELPASPASEIGLDPNIFARNVEESYIRQLKAAVHEAITRVFGLD